MGDWIGREAKGGQAWLTYHLSGNEWVQFEYLNKKTPSNFIGSLTPGGPGGTTQNSYMGNGGEAAGRKHRTEWLGAVRTMEGADL